MNRLILFLIGQRKLSVAAEDAHIALNIFMKYRFVYREFAVGSDGRVHFLCTPRTASRVLGALRAYGVDVSDDGSKGLPLILGRYKGRAGIALGIILASLLIFFSGKFVWDIRIEGNSSLSKAEIIAELENCGFAVGSYLPDVEIGKLENEVLKNSEKLSWISVNMNGTVAYVEVREKEDTVGDTSPKLPANLVAKEDAEIVLLEVYRGQSVVGIGDTVRKGDLLVSGLYDSNTVGYRYTRSYGKVYARTSHSYRIEIPLCYQKKVYTGKVYSEKTLNFFSKSIKVFSNSRNVDTTCDIISYDENLFLSHGELLPFGISTRKMLEYSLIDAVRDENEAMELAFFELDEKMRELTGNAELLEKNIRTEITDDAFIIECDVICIEDIAEQREFPIDLYQKGSTWSKE